MAVGRPQFILYFAVYTKDDCFDKDNRLEVELFIQGDKAKVAFSQLKQHEKEIEEEIGEALTWKGEPERKLPRRPAYRIFLSTDGDIKVKTSWNEYFEWFEKYASLFYKVFSNRVKSLNL